MFEGLFNIEKFNGLGETSSRGSSSLNLSRSSDGDAIREVYQNAINSGYSPDEAEKIALQKANELKEQRLSQIDNSGEYNSGRYQSTPEGNGVEVEKGFFVYDSNGNKTFYESKTAYETAIKNAQNNNITATNAQQDTSQNTDVMQYANYFAYGFVGIMILGILKKLMSRKKSKK